jgi:hypothetical protein
MLKSERRRGEEVKRRRRSGAQVIPLAGAGAQAIPLARAGDAGYARRLRERGDRGEVTGGEPGGQG